jgi:hypothetical protein
MCNKNDAPIMIADMKIMTPGCLTKFINEENQRF